MGGPGRAPRLAGHHYNVNSMFKVITWGIPGTGMPEFTTRLKTEEIADLVAYAMTLGGPAAAPHPRRSARRARSRRKRSKAARCSSTPPAPAPADRATNWTGGASRSAPDLGALQPGIFTNLRSVATRGVVTARPAGEPPFPALLVERTESKVRVYDLTSPLPVLRTFAAARIVLEPGSSWRHEQATRIYTSRELEGYRRLSALAYRPVIARAIMPRGEYTNRYTEG